MAAFGLGVFGFVAGSCAPPAAGSPTAPPATVAPSFQTSTPTAGATETPVALTQTADLPADAAPGFELLVAHVAQEMGVAEDQIRVAGFEAVEFNDSCLGLAGPGEMCLQVITPGYRVDLQTPDGERAFHTNRTGDIFREAVGLLEAG